MMKKHGLFIAILAALSLTAFTVQELWILDRPHSELGFSITHLGISDISGTFDDFEATIESSETDFSDAHVEAVIQVASINTNNSYRDDHLKGPDFFEVERYPLITFKSKNVKRVGEGKFKLSGELTVKDITKNVDMDMWYRGTVENPQNQKTTAGIKLSGTIKRSDFNIGTKYPEAMLSEEVHLDINAEYQKK
ncbi:YceI family protein [Muricauda ruestringensis]|uniref:YceI family protein n=1 Tax=Flagellimonas aurea TaxID=2915619 RepID=A0ABS3G3B6_9FLAO|nr:MULTISPECIES: YceI family protein [Allomuricauda]MBO0353900.1 YceI family protein [Allomuricauda aurea]|tara:strand:+ start:6214 stop:6795 length:582 start_codon:yes stop_codon:yes gene_type:complete